MKNSKFIFDDVINKISLSADKKKELIEDFNKFGFTERIRHRLISVIDNEIEFSKNNISQMKSKLDSLGV